MLKKQPRGLKISVSSVSSVEKSKVKKIEEKPRSRSIKSTIDSTGSTRSTDFTKSEQAADSTSEAQALQGLKPPKPKMKILVSGRGYALDGRSQAKIKGAIKLNSRTNKVEVLIFSEDPQGRSLVVKKAELKSALIRAGLRTTVSLDFKTVDRKGYAEILFY